MRRLRLAWFLGLVLLVACGPEGPDDPGTRSAEPGTPDGEAPPPERADGEAARAVVRGTVRDADTDRPLAEALVSAGELGTATDGTGVFVLPLLPPGETVLEVYRRGFLAEAVTVVLDPGAAASVDVRLQPAPPACCTLAGAWSARFDLDSAGLNARPRSRRLAGRLSLAPRRSGASERPTHVAEARGTTDLDFGPLLGGEVEAGVDDVQGAIFHDDSVAITMLPRFGDWAIELRGRLAQDTISGDWFQRASCCGAYGGFVMVRDPVGAAGTDD